MSIKCFERLKTKEKRVAKNEMVRQYHRLNGHELEQTPGDSRGQGSWRPHGHAWLRFEDVSFPVHAGFSLPSVSFLGPWELVHIHR